MPSKLIRNSSLMIALLLVAAAAQASTVSVSFVGVSQSGTAFGFYIGPYDAQTNNPTKPITVYCVDFNHEVYFGQTYDANLTFLDSQNLGDTRWGTSRRADYEKAAWLTTQYVATPKQNWADIQATIWGLFSSNSPAASSTYWLDQANANYAAMDYHNIAVLSSVTGSVQEFITEAENPNAPFLHSGNAPSDGAQVPEPGSILLLGTVLLCASLVVRRKRTPVSVTASLRQSENR